MNTDTVDLVIFTTGDQAAKHGPGGAVWDDDESHLYVVFPGTKHLDAIAVTRDGEKARKAARTWLLTGTKERPSLQPSLLIHGQWHGYLTNGRLVSC